jgi:predicted dehydrogenase
MENGVTGLIEARTDKTEMNEMGGNVESTDSLKVPAIRARRNPLEAIGVGLIGVGSRGKRHLEEIAETQGTEIRSVCDVFTKRLDWAVSNARKSNPNTKGHADYRRLLDDKDIDAVVIATPDHWHCQMTVDAADAGKDVYVQKAFTRTVPEAKAIVQAVKRNRTILQLAHTRRSEPIYHRMREIYGSGVLGPVSIVNITMFRNSSGGAWDWEIEPEGNPQTIDWKAFLGSAPQRPFDPDRFFRWRKYWDYGTGISGDLLSHEWDAANFVLGLGIPATCVASGGIYYWKEKREVPDVLNVVYDYPDRGMAVTWNCTFSNSAYGMNTGTHIHGKAATLKYNYSEKEVEVFLESQHADQILKEQRVAEPERKRKGEIPLYSFSRGQGFYVSSHFQNFIDCVRSRERTRCNEDDAFEEAVTAVMSVVAYRERRMVRWDPGSQEII